MASEGFDEETHRSQKLIKTFKEATMTINWGPYFIVPSETLKTFSGRVLLRESFDEELLRKELIELAFPGDPVKATNPWYCRKKGTETWIKIGESSNKKENFAVPWDTTKLENGEYEVLGLMHVWVRKAGQEFVVVRQNVVDVTVQN